MKIYKITVDDILAATVDRMAEAENRAASELIAVMLRDWAFGVARRYQPLSDAEVMGVRAKRPQRIPLTAKERNSIFERHAGKCFHCSGQMLYEEPWHIDHIKPVSKGGTNDPANLALSCPRCNLKKSAKVA